MTVSLDDVFENIGGQGLASVGRTMVVYSPRSGSARGIRGHVEHISEVEGRLADIPRVIVTVENSSTKGIALATLDTGGDVLLVPPAPGKSAVAKRIVRVIEYDAGTITMEVS